MAHANKAAPDDSGGPEAGALDLLREQLVSTLRSIAAPATATSSSVYWVSAARANPDNGSCYCRDCCQAKVVKLNQQEPGGGYSVDGGWVTQEDCPRNCEDCGVTLHCLLTEAGVEYELDHWRRNGVNLLGDGAPSEAFHLLAALTGGADDSLTDPLVQRLAPFVLRGERTVTADELSLPDAPRPGMRATS